MFLMSCFLSIKPKENLFNMILNRHIQEIYVWEAEKRVKEKEILKWLTYYENSNFSIDQLIN